MLAVTILLLITLFLALIGIYHTNKSLPAGVSVLGQEYTVPEKSVSFLADVTYVDEAGKRRKDQVIFDEIMAMIDRAQEYILLDMFLYNDFQGATPETYRYLADELTKALIQKKESHPTIDITVISDRLNTVYGGAESKHFKQLEEAGIFVVLTELKVLRDSNPLYSSVWRFIFQWFGNKEKSGFMPHPFAADGHKVTIRSWLSLLNFKANHRKLIVADEGQSNGTTKIVTLITSANPHDGSSAHYNIAVKVEDKLWRDVIKSEQAVGNFSGHEITGFSGQVTDEDGDVVVQLLTEGVIKKRLLALISETGRGDRIDMAMFYLSDRDIINSLISASQRDVEIYLVLDANKDAFSRTKNGVPNRPVAQIMLNKTDNKINIKWCHTHGEQFHSKMILFKIGEKQYLVAGSANLTRRNIADYNLETNVLVSAKEDIQFFLDVRSYFEDLWKNHSGRNLTTSYETYAENSSLKMVMYKVQEFTGLSSF